MNKKGEGVEDSVSNIRYLKNGTWVGAVRFANNKGPSKHVLRAIAIARDAMKVSMLYLQCMQESIGKHLTMVNSWTDVGEIPMVRFCIYSSDND